MSEGWLTALKLLAVVALVLANGFFVAAEFALVAVRRSRVDELVAKGVLGARAVQRAVANLDHFIAATQLGITLASLALGWIGEPTVGTLLERVFGHSPSAAALSFIIAFTIITALHIVVGELAPKSIALQYPERTSLAVAQPLGVFDLVFRPFIVALNAVGRATVRLLGIQRTAGHAELVHSADELRLLVEASGKAGALVESEQRIIERAFDFASFTAHEVMTPRTELVAIPANADGPTMLEITHGSRFTRYPVFGAGLDDIVGVLHVKDLLDAVRAGRLETVIARDLAREALVVPDGLAADELLDRMRESNRHMAVVIDEFGGLAGAVTLEDVLERLVGALRDEFEHRDVEPEMQPQADGSVLLSGLTLIADANQRFGLAIDTTQFDTLGGFIFGALGRLPAAGDRVETGGARLEVVAMDSRRVDRVRLTPSPRPAGRPPSLSLAALALVELVSQPLP